MQSARKFLKNELRVFEHYFDSTLKSHVALMNNIMRYITRRKGKQIRPIFVLLSASLLDTPNEKTYRAASLVELLHTATLVHDDVVDEAPMRRGVFSIVALWKSKVAVLVGDYLLSKGLLLSLENEDFDSLRLLSTAVKDMSEGELLQLEKSRKLNITEEEYFKVIKGKTASLLSAACAAGLNSVSEDEEKLNNIRELGTEIGIAFQIKDDLFDFQKNDTGKSLANDLKEKKLTLPIIHALENTNPKSRKRILRYISSKKGVKKYQSEIFNFVRDNHGIDYAQSRMNESIARAHQLLDRFPDTEARAEFHKLIDYVIERNK